MTLPNFLIIGAAKSGTTALYRYLKQHPDIFMSSRKEPHFFSYTNDTKLTNGPGDYIRTAVTDFAQYQMLFQKAKNEKAIGEASPTYIYVPGTAQKIQTTLPSVKIIAILRNPADRAFSAYMHLIRDGFETISDFELALSKEQERIADNWGPIWHYTKAGFYFEQLLPYYRLFEKQQLKIIIYDDFQQDPLKVMRNLFSFLDVDNSFTPDMSAKPNVSGIPKNKNLQKMMDFLFNQNNPIRDISRKVFSEDIRWRVTSGLRNKNLNQPAIPYKLRKYLIEIFQDDIIRLQKLIDYDLSKWLKS